MAKKIKTIGQAVPALLTFLVAETCLGKADIVPTDENVNFLVTFANYQFNRNEQFKKGILSKSNKGRGGRDFLYTFMNHWVQAKMWEKHTITEDMKPYQEQIPDYAK